MFCRSTVWGPSAQGSTPICFERRRKSVKITGIWHITVPIESNMANAFINFSQMNVSVLAIETDQFRDGK